MSKNLMVVKRSGEVVDFEEERIKGAILNAVKSIDANITEDQLDDLVAGITQEIEDRFVEMYPNVENVQDIVEKHLVKNDYYEISKEYMLYRAQRQQEREQKKKETIEKAKLGKLTVNKRDGTNVIFDINKMKSTIKRAARGVEDDVSIGLITKEAVKNIYDGISTEEIEKALILAATSFIERDPAYDTVASRIYLQRIYKEIIGKSTKNDALGISYRNTFTENIKRGVEDGVLDERMLDYDLNKMAYAMKLDRDNLLSYMSLQTLYERYFLKTKNEQERLELPQAFWMRIAMGIALNEEEKEKKAIEFYNIMSSKRFVPSTPTLFHAGTTHSQLSSCYLTTIEDDLDHIFKCIGDNARLSKWSGGLGNDWTNIRATGALIKSTNVESQGTIPFLKIANDTTAAINRSGKRRGATCAYLETWHLDIEDFLDLKRNTGDDRRRTHDMNTANWIPDLFMKRVINDEQWTLFSPDETPELHHIYGKEFEKKYKEYEEKARNGEMRKHKVVSAKKLWRKMLTRLFETGHPWIVFKDPCNIRSPQDHAGVIHSSNLCTEITLNTSADETAVCNLGSVNLSKHVKNGKIDKEKIEETVNTAMRMLDNVIDLNFYPTPEAKNANMKHRPVGMGVMGLQDMMYMVDIPMDSPAALEFNDNLLEFISYHAILASSRLAKERGPYPSFEGSKWDRNIFPVDTIDMLEEERGVKIEINREERLDWTPVREHVQKYGMRNSNTMALAPTATISTISGCFPTIEPIYKNIYVKANMSGEFTIVNHYLVEDLKERNLWNNEMLEKLKYHDGSVQPIPEIPDELKRKYKEAFEIDPEWLMKLNAARAKWIDQSQSHNVFMKGTSGKKLNNIYIKAWKLGLKTTYYLRSMAASQIEKSTLDAKKYGYTQKRKEGVETENVIEETSQEETEEKQPEKVPVSPLVSHANKMDAKEPNGTQTNNKPSSPLYGKGFEPEKANGDGLIDNDDDFDIGDIKNPGSEVKDACSLFDPDCEACQ